MSQPGIVVQARMGSSRLPGKVMQELAGAPALARLFERLRRVKCVSAIVLATSTQQADDVIANFVLGTPDIKLWRGPEQDVLKRYADAARHFNLDPIVRITSDCPLMQPDVIEQVMDAFLAMPGCGYADNIRTRTFPHGFDVQIASRTALEIADAEACKQAEREHVMPFLMARPDRFPATYVQAAEDHADLRLTLDYPEDLALIRAIYERLYPINPRFVLDDVLALRRREPELFELNSIRKIY